MLKMNIASVFVCAIAITLALVIFGSQGVRGTDQYWYVSDVQSLIDGDSTQTTNMFFPGKLLREGDSPTPNYFMHNGFALKAAAFLGEWFGAYHGWIIVNTLLHMIAACCVLISCNRFLKPRRSAWIVVFYLLSPIAIWQTVNPLLEQSYAAMTSLFLLGYLYHTRTAGFLVLLLAIALGVPSHPIFLPPALAVVSLFGWRMFSLKSKYYLVGFIASGMVLALAYLIGKSLLPSSFQPNLQAIITSAIPGKSNMFWHYSFDQYPVSIDLMLAKFSVAIERHLLTPRLAPFFVFTNAAVLLGSWLMFVRFKKLFWLILPACMFYGLYFSIIFLQQNHPRYQQIIAPVTFIILAIFLSEVRIKIPSLMKYLSLAAVIFVNGFMLNISRAESREEAIDIAKLKRELSLANSAGSFVTFDVMPHNPVSYTLRPDPLLAIRTDMLTENQIIECLDRFRPDYALSKFAIVDEYLGKKFHAITQIDSEIFGRLYLYSMRD